jgi:hypothetical protein
MIRSIVSRVPFALALAFALTRGGGAAAHVGPSPSANNRYVKLTLLGDRLRVLYTFYVGDQPGARARRALDRNADGMLDADETSAFGDETAAAVATNLELRIDGQLIALRWDQVLVGMGTPVTSAGAFSVDLVAWPCFPSLSPRHSLALYDRWTPPAPGETELRIEGSPGVQVSRATLGDDPASQLVFRWTGANDRIGSEGLRVAFVVDTARADLNGGACASAPTATAPATSPRWLAAIATLAALAAGFTVRARRRSADVPRQRRGRDQAQRTTNG